MNQILTKEVVENFYNYGAPIDEKITLDKSLHGLTLRDIMFWSDSQHEECHGHVQILFPNVMPSKMNPHAPIIQDYSVFDNVYKYAILDTVLNFTLRYGFNPLVYCKDFCANHAIISRWLRNGDHNVLRMTRLMHFLKGVGLNIEFETTRNILLHYVDALDRGKSMSYTTYIWRNL